MAWFEKEKERTKREIILRAQQANRRNPLSFPRNAFVFLSFFAPRSTLVRIRKERWRSVLGCGVWEIWAKHVEAGDASLAAIAVRDPTNMMEIASRAYILTCYITYPLLHHIPWLTGLCTGLLWASRRSIVDITILLPSAGPSVSETQYYLFSRCSSCSSPPFTTASEISHPYQPKQTAPQVPLDRNNAAIFIIIIIMLLESMQTVRVYTREFRTARYY